MLTELARQDLKALRAQGFNPTDEEIVALNDLAMRIERGQNTTPYNMPRIGFAGSVVLHEPTVGALQWWAEYGQNADILPERRAHTYFFMLANARNLNRLFALTTPKEIRKAVREWRKGLDCTEDELWRAVSWVKFGAEEIKAQYDAMVRSTIDDEEAMSALWHHVICCAGAIHVCPDSLMTMTRSELISTLIQASMYAHVPLK